MSWPAVRPHPRGGRVITSRPTWEAAMREATRRRQVCLEKFGPASHGWVFTVRATPVRYPRRNENRWWITFDPEQVRTARARLELGAALLKAASQMEAR